MRAAQRRILALTACAVVAAVVGVAAGSRSRDVAPVPPALPLSHISAYLEDEVEPLAGDRIRWSTYWTLRWAPDPQAVAYEMQVVTSEGPARRLRRVSEPRFRIEVASGEHPRREGMRRRALLLALAAGQMAYRVRTVLADGRVGPWSPHFDAGKPVSAP